MKGRILLIEDEELIGSMVELNLARDGWRVEWLREGLAVADRAKSADYDLIILDIMLPDADGVTLAGELRKAGVATPILMLTAKSDVQTKIKALDRGADDYLTKPFDLAELAARVRALVRRTRGDLDEQSPTTMFIGRYEVDADSRMAITREGRVQLSAKEIDLLNTFVRHAGATRSRADILEEVWGMDVLVSERTIDNFILRFRKLFEADPENPRLFLTVRGVGYRYEKKG